MNQDIHQQHIEQINAFIIAEDDPLEKTKLMFWLSMVNEQARIADKLLSTNTMHNRRFDDTEIRLSNIKREVARHTKLADKTDTALYIFSAIGGLLLIVAGFLSRELYYTIETLQANQIQLMTNQHSVMDNQKQFAKIQNELQKALGKLK